MVLHWHPHPVSDVVFTNDGMLFLTLLCALIVGLSGHYLLVAFKWLTIFPGSTLYVILVKSNQWSVINAAFCECVVSHTIYLTIIPLALMASESIAIAIDSEPIRAQGIIVKQIVCETTHSQISFSYQQEQYKKNSILLSIARFFCKCLLLDKFTKRNDPPSDLHS